MPTFARRIFVVVVLAAVRDVICGFLGFSVFIDLHPQHRQSQFVLVATQSAVLSTVVSTLGYAAGPYYDHKARIICVRVTGDFGKGVASPELPGLCAVLFDLLC